MAVGAAQRLGRLKQRDSSNGVKPTSGGRISFCTRWNDNSPAERDSVEGRGGGSLEAALGAALGRTSKARLRAPAGSVPQFEKRRAHKARDIFEETVAWVIFFLSARLSAPLHGHEVV